MDNVQLQQLISNSLTPTPSLNDFISQQVASLPKKNYGLRQNGTPKGFGYFGELKRPTGGVSGELSTTVDFGKGEMLIPTLVPTLNKDEVQYLLNTAPGSKPLPKSIIDKAVQFASARLANGLDVFAQPNEIPYGIKQ